MVSVAEDTKNVKDAYEQLMTQRMPVVCVTENGVSPAYVQRSGFCLQHQTQKTQSRESHM